MIEPSHHKLVQPILRLLLSEADREVLIGDLAEEHAEVAAERGTRRAALWYIKQVAHSVAPLICKAVRAGWLTSEPVLSPAIDRTLVAQIEGEMPARRRFLNYKLGMLAGIAAASSVVASPKLLWCALSFAMMILIMYAHDLRYRRC